jgi:hypothetical protein
MRSEPDLDLPRRDVGRNDELERVDVALEARLRKCSLLGDVELAFDIAG